MGNPIDWQADVSVTVTLRSSKGQAATTSVEVGMTVPLPQGDDRLIAETVNWCGRAASAAVAEKWSDGA